MAQWYYFDEKDEKQGPIRGKELVKYVEQGVITPETWVEDEKGQKVKAKHVTGLPFPEKANGTMSQAENFEDSDSIRQRNDFDRTQKQGQVRTPNAAVPPPVGQNPFTGAFPAAANPFAVPSPPSPFTQTFPTAPPPAGQVFCTNCGNPVAEQAAVCMSCGMKPTGHKKFCRYCRTALNPEQVLCTVCGASVGNKTMFALNSLNSLNSLASNWDFQKIRDNARWIIIAAVAFLVLAVYGSYRLTDLLDKDKRTARRDLKEIYAVFQESQKKLNNPQSIKNINPWNFSSEMDEVTKSIARKKKANFNSWEKAVEKHCHEGEVLLGISGIFDLNTEHSFQVLSLRSSRPSASRVNLELKLSESVEWFHKSAEGGNPIGQFLYAMCVGGGIGVSENSAESLKWAREAAEGGLLEAQMLLAAAYGQGLDDIPQDEAEAVKWLRKVAARSEQTVAQGALGMLYFEGKGIEKDVSEAVKWFRKAAKKDLTEAQGMLGKCYYEGLGVSKNEKEAVEWLTKASDKGHTESQWLLGLCYLNGQGGLKVEKTKGVRLIVKSAEEGNTEAAYQLAVCYRDGEGVPKNLDEALRWARSARTDGEPTELEKQILRELN